ncbi:hypothetical protein [Actinophytocola sp.]|uniref:hypothetical protein n=1 Tax=Actinophytocola sp. TaxID=1872138 RepID=UPI002ED1FAD2
MRADRGVRLRQWLLLAALAFALVGMHHVPSAPCGPHVEVTSHTLEQEQHCHTPEGGHDLLHLCLMVLGAVAGVLLVWLLLAITGSPRTPTRRVRARARPRGLAGRALLTSVCVLRT